MLFHLLFFDKSISRNIVIKTKYLFIKFVLKFQKCICPLIIQNYFEVMIRLIKLTIIVLIILSNICALVLSNKNNTTECTIWNNIIKCFRIFENNTHCYETTLIETFCCNQSISDHDVIAMHIVDNKCIKYGEAEHEIFLQKIFILGIGILILVSIGSIICYWRTHACSFEYRNGQIVLEVVEAAPSTQVPSVPTHSESKSPKKVLTEF